MPSGTRRGNGPTVPTQPGATGWSGRGHPGERSRASGMLTEIRTLIRYRALIQSLGLAGAEGALPRQHARLPVELREPAAAAAHLHARLHVRAAEPRSLDPALLALPLLRHPALDLVPGLARRVVGRHHRERQPDQEGAVPGRGAADRQRAHEPRPFPAGPADPAGVPGVPAPARLDGARPAAADARAARALARPRPLPVRAHRALPGHPEHPDPRAAPVVLRDAGHLLLCRAPRERRCSGGCCASTR